MNREQGQRDHQSNAKGAKGHAWSNMLQRWMHEPASNQPFHAIRAVPIIIVEKNKCGEVSATGPTSSVLYTEADD
jgi:hypothetical protein